MDKVVIAAFNIYQESSVSYAKPKTMKGVVAAVERLLLTPNVHMISIRIIRQEHEPQQKIDSYADVGGVAVLSSDPEADMDKGFKRTSDMAKAARSTPTTRPRRSVGKEEI